MKIPFGKIGATPRPFTLEHRGVGLAGQMHKKSLHCIDLSARLTGEILLECDRCGSPYLRHLDEMLKLGITDEVVQDKEDLDIIEFLDGVIDVAYIIESEINAWAGEYHLCPDCAQNDAPIDIEL